MIHLNHTFSLIISSILFTQYTIHEKGFTQPYDMMYSTLFIPFPSLQPSLDFSRPIGNDPFATFLVSLKKIMKVNDNYVDF